MTVQGHYNVTVHTPFGPQQGALTLEVIGSSLSGRLENPKGASDFSGGTVIGNEVEFTSKIRTPMGRLKAEVFGTVEGDRFTGTGKLPLGTVRIEGQRA